MKQILLLFLLAISSFAEDVTVNLPEKIDPLYHEILELISMHNLKSEEASKAISNAYSKIGIPIEIDDPRENSGYRQALNLSMKLTLEDLDKFQNTGTPPFVDFVSREAVFIHFFTNSNCQKIEFDKKGWNQLIGYSRKRYRMMKGFVETHHPIGKDPSYLLNALGKPSFKNDYFISYELGAAWHPMDDTFITFEIESGIVMNYKIHANIPNMKKPKSGKEE